MKYFGRTTECLRHGDLVTVIINQKTGEAIVRKTVAEDAEPVKEEN